MSTVECLLRFSVVLIKKDKKLFKKLPKKIKKITKKLSKKTKNYKKLKRCVKAADNKHCKVLINTTLIIFSKKK